jgi:endonuclease III related protein
LKNNKQLLLEIYRRLFELYGPQHWWPGESPFEVMVGAILTQSTAWQNVEKAITNLKNAGIMSPSALRDISTQELAKLIYPAGYYNAKALKLQALVNWLWVFYGDNLRQVFALNTETLRTQLLAIHGIGPETADSILLYAANKPVFVIDTYTRRIIHRLDLTPENDSYDAYQTLFTGSLPQNTQLFNEYHACLVRLGKEACWKQPHCDGCCLLDICNRQV